MRFVALVPLLAFAQNVFAAEPAAVDFFEKKVRPVLADNCFSCHGEKKQEAGLRLDSREAVLKGSDSGPIVASGSPEKSRLIKAVRHDGDIKMPKDSKKLSQEAIEALVNWIKIGVPFPANATAKSGPTNDPRRHWAFQPLQPVQPPKCKEPGTPLDCFVQAKLEEKGLALSPVADKRTLVRRAFFDLHGMPPTTAQIEEFIADQSSNAFQKLVDRLLASPHYGEAQARRWLDLARYSDTKGYVFQEDRNYPFAYTYRDWVIRAFNEDMPYDRFVMLQIAADRMNPTDKRDLAALGFQTLGRRFLNNLPDIIDDRLDVTFRTTLGLTIACARCHDHKFDPIPASDYYSLYGVFASSVEPKELPLIGEAPRTPEVIAFEKQLKKLEEEANSINEKLFKENLAKLRTAKAVAAYMLGVRDARGKRGEEIQALFRDRDLKGFIFDRWRNYLEEQTRGHSPVFAAWKALSDLPADKFNTESAKAAVEKLVAESAKKSLPLNPIVMKGLAAAKQLATMKDVAAAYADILTAGNAQKNNPDHAAVAAVLGKGGPLDISVENANRLFNTAERNKIVELHRKADEFKATSPNAPPRAMVLNDSPNLYNPYVFLRGNPGNHGPSVPRQFLQVLSQPNRKPFADGSGRLDLAKAIADPKNPLTARVMVNRLWMTHFGVGLVRTPSDFGVRTEQPAQPEMFDWLANQFIESGWSMKKIHRMIMLSRTYQQSSEITPELARLDPENRLLARMNRRRFDFEALRDGLLLTAGNLDASEGGRPVDIFKEPFSHRRSIYAFIDRQNLPGTFRVFDFASPDNHSPQRFVTTVPQQALFLLNSPFVIEQARSLIARTEIASAISDSNRVEQLYRLVYGRPATSDETAVTLAFLGNATENAPQPEASKWQYGFGAYDAQTQRVKTFSPMPHFTGSAWQAGPALPDKTHGWVILNGQGGHPGKNPDHAVIRRWVAPRDGEIVISGTLRHPNKEGDGVRGRIVSSKAGELGAWKVKNSQVEINVQAHAAKGDTIDFVTDCLQDENSDSFVWAPHITLRVKDGELVWDAAADFSGPASKPAHGLTKWEQLAQVLLLSNEFAFVD